MRTEAALDYDTKNSYAVTVTATDGDNASDSIAVTITVTEVDEDVVAGDPLLVKYDADKDGKINLDETLAAVAQYFVIDRSASATDQEKQNAVEEVLDVVARFFRDSRAS